MTRPTVVDISIHKQGSDLDLRLFARMYTQEDVQTVQTAIDSFLYDLTNDIRAADKKER